MILKNSTTLSALETVTTSASTRITNGEFTSTATNLLLTSTYPITSTQISAGAFVVTPIITVTPIINVSAPVTVTSNTTTYFSVSQVCFEVKIYLNFI